MLCWDCDRSVGRELKQGNQHRQQSICPSSIGPIRIIRSRLSVRSKQSTDRPTAKTLHNISKTEQSWDSQHERWHIRKKNTTLVRHLADTPRHRPKETTSPQVCTCLCGRLDSSLLWTELYLRLCLEDAAANAITAAGVTTPPCDAGATDPLPAWWMLSVPALGAA